MVERVDVHHAIAFQPDEEETAAMVGVFSRVVEMPAATSKKPFDTRNRPAPRVIASGPEFAATGGRSAVKFHSFVAVSDVSEPVTSYRRILGRLIPLLLLFRSDETYIPARLPVVNVRSSESGSPVPSG
jgi:hypothetical protein